MTVLDVGERLMTPSERLGLAAANELPAHRRGRSFQGESPPERTAAFSCLFCKQQNDVLRQIPKMLNVGMALDLVWAMDAHHRETLPGGASLNKALAILRDPISGRPPHIREQPSERVVALQAGGTSLCGLRTRLSGRFA